MAIEEINAAGGVHGQEARADRRGRRLGLADLRREVQEADLSSDKVAVVFGCWTSASRKAVLPVFESLKGLLFYPVQYEGLETSPNIFYTGATTNQQIVPAVDYLLKEGKKKFFLLGSDYVFPRTANDIIKAQLEGAGRRARRRGVHPARPHRLQHRHQQDQGRQARTSSSTP